MQIKLKTEVVCFDMEEPITVVSYALLWRRAGDLVMCELANL